MKLVYLVFLVTWTKVRALNSEKRLVSRVSQRARRARGGGLSLLRKRRVEDAVKEEVESVLSESCYWHAVLHNWLYFLSLGLCIPTLPRVIASVVNEDGSTQVSARSARIGGDVEGVDKLLTFLGVGALGAMSDVVGRKAMIATGAFGYATTVALQLSAKRNNIKLLFFADMVDGATSCMNAVCSAYVIDVVRDPAKRAVAVGVFQGLSVGGAFVVGFPLAGILSKKNLEPRRPMMLAVALQVLNALLALFWTPESLSKANRRPLSSVVSFIQNEGNPIAALSRLFGPKTDHVLRAAAEAFAFAWLANLALNTVFVNYVNAVFNWGPQQSGPLLVVVGLLLAIVPRFAVSTFGLELAIQLGAFVFAVGYASIGLFAKTNPKKFFISIMICGLGATVVPALTALVATRASDSERGAVLGALQTLQELCGAFAYPIYGRVLAAALTESSKIPKAAPFYLASASLLITLGLAKFKQLGKNEQQAAL